MRLHHLAAATAALTFVLMTLGSLVHGTGSSLACPDWPLCNGNVFPAMTGGVEYEHTHRLVALAVATLVTLLFFRTRRERRPMTRRLAATALVLVLIQAGLGALTVVLRLPPAVSIAHFATSALVLTTLVLLALDTAPTIIEVAAPTANARAWLGVATLATLAQAIAGAAVRHTGAALACPGFPLCAGEVWPNSPLARLQMLHRIGALLVVVVVFVACARARRADADEGPPRLLVLAPCAIVLAQIVLGVVVVLVSPALPLVTAHHATGVLLTASLVALWGALEVQHRRGVVRAAEG